MQISLSTAYTFVTDIPPLSLTQYVQKMFGIINVDFDATAQLSIMYPEFVKYLRKM